MKFTTKTEIQQLKENVTHTGFISKIREVTTDKGTYYEVKVEVDEGVVSIWVSDEVNPTHPMYDVFKEFVTEETAEDFDVNEIVGIEIRFTVKTLLVHGKKGEMERTFFDKVTPVFEEEEDE